MAHASNDFSSRSCSTSNASLYLLLDGLEERGKASGITEQMIVNAYKSGETFYDPRYSTRVHYSPKEGIAVVELRSGEVNSVFNADPPS